MKSITRTPRKAINDGLVTGVDFAGLENCKHKDNSLSASAYAASSTSISVSFSDCGFNIPTGAIIKKIEVNVTSTKSGGSATHNAKLIYGANLKMATSSYAELGFVSSSYQTKTATGNAGFESDVFGVNLTPEIVNSSYFGIYLTFPTVSTPIYIYLDHVSVTVYYEESTDTRIKDKNYEVLVYSNSGAYLTSLNEVINDISFTQEINTAGCELQLKLARNAGDYGEGTDIDFGYGIKIMMRDTDDPGGSCIFNGYIASYTPIYSNNTVDVTVISYGDELSRFMLQEYVGETGDGSPYWALKGPLIGAAPLTGNYELSRTITVPTGTTQIQQIYLNVTGVGAGYPVEYELIRSSTVIGEASQRYGNQYGFLIADFLTPVSVTAGETLTIKAIFDTVTPLNAYTVYGNYGDSGIGYKILPPDGTTEITFNSKDPGQILRDVIEKYRQQGGVLDYDDATVELTGTTVSYTFNANTTLEAINKCLELAPSGWYWYVDVATNLVHFHAQPVTPDHTFALEKHLLDAKFEKRIEDMVNTVYFTGGGDPPLYKKFVNQNSIKKYGIKASKYIDQRVTNATTAETIANSIIEKRSEPELRVTLDLIDNNGEQYIGYNLESIKVGDVVSVRNITQRVGLSSWDVSRWDSDYWDFNIYNLSSLQMQVLRYSYSPNKATIYASTILPDVNKRIEDINRNLEASQTYNNPTAPE